MPVQSFEKCASEECSQKFTRNNSVAASEQDNASVVAKHCNFELPSDSMSLSSDLSDQKAASTTLDPSTRNGLNPIKHHKGLLGGSTTPGRIRKKNTPDPSASRYDRDRSDSDDSSSISRELSVDPDAKELFFDDIDFSQVEDDLNSMLFFDISKGNRDVF